MTWFKVSYSRIIRSLGSGTVWQPNQKKFFLKKSKVIVDQLSVQQRDILLLILIFLLMLTIIKIET